MVAKIKLNCVNMQINSFLKTNILQLLVHSSKCSYILLKTLRMVKAAIPRNN